MYIRNYIVSASTDQMARLWSDNGEYVGTFGQVGVQSLIFHEFFKVLDSIFSVLIHHTVIIAFKLVITRGWFIIPLYG